VNLSAYDRDKIQRGLASLVQPITGGFRSRNNYFPSPSGVYVRRKRSFWPYITNGGTHIACSGGSVIFLSQDVQTVSAMTATAGTDGLLIWLDITNAKSISIGSGVAWPADKLYIPLLNGITEGTGDKTGYFTISDDDRFWFGGDMILPEMFPVTLAQSGGAAGPPCTYTYTASLYDTTELPGGPFSPQNSAARIFEAKVKTAANSGTMRWSSAGALELWDCNEKVEYKSCDE